MSFEDKVLTCVSCGAEFPFTAGEQEFFAEKGFEHQPKRCRKCKVARRRDLDGEHSRRAAFSVSCAQCGRSTTVPFQPSQGRPVYCRSCFEARRAHA